MHVISYASDSALDRLGSQLPELSKLGINCLILEVNYSFEFRSHPELRQGDRQITKAGVQKVPDEMQRERNRTRPAVSMSRAPVVVEEYRPAAHEVSGARSDAGRLSQ